MSSKKIEIKLIKSPIGHKTNAKRTLISLGLTKMNKTIVKNNTLQIQSFQRVLFWKTVIILILVA